MSPDLDLELLRRWIGKEEVVDGQLSVEVAARFHDTLDFAGPSPEVGAPARRLIHFCLTQPSAPTATLSNDGHQQRGGFLPPVPLPRRMWAGSRIRFAGDLFVGDEVRRRSRIADVSVKEGRSGPLCFVTVEHLLSVAGKARVRESQTLVYRDAGSASKPMAVADWERGETVETASILPTLLFRYSALTFNGHRIHYDARYAREVEGYPGLVVHGPLQATLLLGLAARIEQRLPSGFDFRSLSPLFDQDSIELHAGARSENGLELWSARSGGPRAMVAHAYWN